MNCTVAEPTEPKLRRKLPSRELQDAAGDGGDRDRAGAIDRQRDRAEIVATAELAGLGQQSSARGPGDSGGPARRLRGTDERRYAGPGRGTDKLRCAGTGQDPPT